MKWLRYISCNDETLITPVSSRKVLLLFLNSTFIQLSECIWYLNKAAYNRPAFIYLCCSHLGPGFWVGGVGPTFRSRTDHWTKFCQGMQLASFRPHILQAFLQHIRWARSSNNRSLAPQMQHKGFRSTKRVSNLGRTRLCKNTMFLHSFDSRVVLCRYFCEGISKLNNIFQKYIGTWTERPVATDTSFVCVCSCTNYGVCFLI